MKAMILAAGLGSRLGEITKNTPKCLIDVGGKSMLEYVVQRLKEAGVTELVINLHYLADAVKEFVVRKKYFDLTVHFSYEPEILGTGGGVKAAAQYLADESFFIYNADIFCELDLKRLYAVHTQSQNLVTLAVMKRETSRPLLFSQEGQLAGWESKENSQQELLTSGKSVQRLAFTGIQIVSPQIFSYMQDEKGAFSSIKIYMKAAQAAERVQAFDIGEDFWIDMGTPEKLATLRQYLL